MPDAHDFYFDEMSQVRLPTWSAGRVALLGDAAFGPSPLSGQGTSLALIGAYLLAHHIAASDDPPTALVLWENGFRANVEQNQRLATDGMATCRRRHGWVCARNQSVRMLPLVSRVGGGFGGRIERASRGVALPRPLTVSRQHLERSDHRRPASVLCVAVVVPALQPHRKSCRPSAASGTPMDIQVSSSAFMALPSRRGFFGPNQA